MSPRIPAPAAYAMSAALHAAAFLGLVRLPALAAPASDEVKVEVVEVAHAPPEPPTASPPPQPRRAPRATPLAPPREAPKPPAPVPEAPPPPNAPPPEDAPPAAKAPVRIGISMSSSTTPGGVAAPAGNTLYGELPRTAPDPSTVKPYRSDNYVPPTQVTVLPRPLDACYRTSAEDYPEEAERLRIEGRVRLALDIDEAGAVAGARVLEEPGHGLGPAAIASLRRNGCRFSPPRRGGDPVRTTIVFTYRFELP